MNPVTLDYNKQGESLRRDSVLGNVKVRGIFSTFLKWVLLTTTFGYISALKTPARASKTVKQANDC